MAIIKCPECGHQVSEKAPVCPNCGVEISGKVVRCPKCGEVYFADQPICPACHSVSKVGALGQSTPNGAAAPPVEAGDDSTGNPSGKRKNWGPYILSCLFATIVTVVCVYFYYDATSQKEQEDYEYAMNSTDPMVLQSYLDRYKDADPVHRDSIQAHLVLLQQIDEDWTNAVVSGSRSELELYLRNHPDSPHKNEALNKLDSIDYIVAEKEKTEEAYKLYLQQHPEGKYVDMVNEAIKTLAEKTVQPEEAQTVKGIFRRFFQSINSRNEDGVLATVSEVMSSLLNRQNATKNDVLTFISRLYKDNVSNMNWHIIDDYKIDKMPLGDGQYEYNVEFSAEQYKELKDNTTETLRYKIFGTVDSEGKISRFTMQKVTE